MSSTGSVATPRHPQHKPNLVLNLDQSRPITPDTPHSPLLHSHFPTRDSVVSGSTYYDDSFDSGSHPDSLSYDAIDEHPQFSSVNTWRDSSKPQSGSGDGGNGRGLPAEVQQKSYVRQADDRGRSNLNRPVVSQGSDLRHSDFLDYYLDRTDGSGEDFLELPTVIVSSPDDNPSMLRGRAPMIKPVMANFSRPLRDSGQWHGADAIAERVTPQLPPHMREKKRAVLERNATKQTAPIVTTPSYKPSPLSKEMTGHPPGLGHSAINTVAQPGPYNATPPPGSSMLQPHPSSEMRSASPSSIYSNYSYYQYEGLLPSPVLTGRETTTSMEVPPTDNRGPSPVRTGSPNPDRESTPLVSPNEIRGSPVNGTQTAQNFLLLGIDHHEANRLQESARCFERSAKEGGGCGVGMLMYGLSLRHGWGCPKNEALGFKWVRKAAESAVEDLEQLRVGKANIDKCSIQAELVLAIYEVGQCFFHGWGVAKDQKMGFSYYMVAARLGDGDAQGDLAFCLANGKGCKKNKKEAARWYRAAVQQGQSDVGLAWIYKDKYQD